MRRAAVRWAAFVLAALGAGCGGGDDTTPAQQATTGAGGAATTTTSAGGAPHGGAGQGGAAGDPVIDIVVDANRDGAAKPGDPADEAGKLLFDETQGASFLANLDDDDKDKKRDAEDDKVNGDEDAKDLAPIVIAAWPDAPDGTKGMLVLDDASVDAVRIFKKTAAGYELVLGSVGVCDTAKTCTPTPKLEVSTDDVRAGLSLFIEGRHFHMSDKDAWTGDVTLSWSLADAEGKTLTNAAHKDGVDKAMLRVAPWILLGNLSPFTKVHVLGDSAVFVKGVTQGVTAASLALHKIGNWGDQWVQDWQQFGYTHFPGQDGKGHGMAVANARPWGRDNGAQYLPITWLNKNYLGPDQATLAVYKKANSGDSYDSHGNHDTVPPYETATAKYPLGRIIIGSGVLPETIAFYEAQHVQAPRLTLDTSWLDVGHIDEFTSFVPAKTKRGWKLLIASPEAAIKMLQDAQAAGHGAEKMFIGKQVWNAQDQLVSATVTIDDVLADKNRMGWSQEAQTHIDENRKLLVKELELADDEIIEVPTLFEKGYEGLVAYTPGTVNQLQMGNYSVMADPFGPVIDGKDIFQKDLTDRVGSAQFALGTDGQGLRITFTDDWDEYHALEGEVHCGTNPEAAAPFTSTMWWETKR
jgi:protein-arginine deiminase